MKKHYFLFVALIAIVLYGCKKEEPEVQPSAKFSYNTNGLTAFFTDESLNAQRYHWDFGDGSTSSEKDPHKTYAKGGTYKVTLNVTNVTLSDSVSKNITISVPAPKASFTYEVAQPLKVVLTNTSTNAFSYQWDFGDGTTSTEKSPTHRYSNIGVYKIKLTAKSNGKTSTCETNVTIEAPTACYITGFTINKIPVNNNYYQVQLTDDYILSKTTYLYTEWYLLSSANIPFHQDLTSQKKLDINSSYVVRLYKRSSKPSGQADGKGDYYSVISSTNLNAYPDKMTWSGTNINMDLFFVWK